MHQWFNGCVCMYGYMYIVHLASKELTYGGNRDEEDGINVEADGEGIIMIVQPTHVPHICL